MVLKVTMDAKIFVVISLYKPNNKSEQIEVLNKLFTMMKTIDINKNTNLLLLGYFNVLFNTNLKCCRGNPSLK